MLEVASPELFHAIYTDHLRGELTTLAEHGLSNFVVSKAFEYANPIFQFGTVPSRISVFA